MRAPDPRVLVVTVVATVAMTSCTLTFGSDDGGASVGPSDVAPIPSAPPAAGRSTSGRLAIVERNGGLYTILPDGSDLVELAPGGNGVVTAVQPTWSPDGRHLAWVLRDGSAGPAGGSIVVAGPRGEDPVATPTPFVPFYLAWDPTGTRVAFLGAGGDPEVPVEMGVLTLDHDIEPPRAIAGGSPFFFFAWGPGGQRIVAHAGVNRLEEIDLAGRTTPVTTKPGLFSTPAWSTVGRTLAYVERGPKGVQRLMVRTGGSAPRSVAQGRGVLSFVLRPDGRAVAYQLLGPGEGDFSDPTKTGAGGIRVVDLTSGRTQQATDLRAMTFSWSPDGTRLLALSPLPAASGAIPFSWQVWNGRGSSTLRGVHSPTLEVLRDYAPFFTQYAQNTTPWAPDGSAFAYAEEEADGVGEIVVQRIGGDPVVIGSGVFVTWSSSGA
jgi:WD40-like Beta Propeller Repeat